MIEKWDEITEFQESMGPPYSPNEYALGLFMEVAELVDSIQFKPWRKGCGKVKDRENLKREIVDCLFFLHHIGEAYNITPGELRQKYKEVMKNNKRRYSHGN